MTYPKLVALDTDGTIFIGQLNRDVWGKGPNASEVLQDNIEPVDDVCLRDRSNHAHQIYLSKDIPRIITEILANGALLAIVSRNTSKDLCDRALYYFQAADPWTHERMPIIHIAKYDEVVNEPKTHHFGRIQKWTGFEYSDMILFDSEIASDVAQKGVDVYNCRSRGLTWEIYSEGIKTWQKRKQSPKLPTVPELLGNAAKYALEVYVNGGTTHSILTHQVHVSSNPIKITLDIPVEFLRAADNAIKLTEEYARNHQIALSDRAIEGLQSLLDRISPDNHPDRHYLLFNLAVALRRRVEIQMTEEPTETLIELHLTRTRSFILSQRAIEESPDDFELKSNYFENLGQTACLYSGVIVGHWESDDLEKLLHQVQSRTNNPVCGILADIYAASCLSALYMKTGETRYHQDGRNKYRKVLRSMDDIFPLKPMIDTFYSLNLLQLPQAVLFVSDILIPFIGQFLALTMQRLVEVPLSAVIGRHLAAIGFSTGFFQQGVLWLEQCLTLVWRQQDLCTAMLSTVSVRNCNDNFLRITQSVTGFLGVAVHVDSVAGNRSLSVIDSEKWARQFFEKFLALRKEGSADPVHKYHLEPPRWDHILHASYAAPVAMINVWDKQCDVLLLLGEGSCITMRLEGVDEDFATELHALFQKGLQSERLQSRGYEMSANYRGTRPIPRQPGVLRVLALLWQKVVKPIIHRMELTPFETSTPIHSIPRLIWCLIGPTSFFPLHAAGLYDTKERGTKSYEYFASSYTPTLSILADANNYHFTSPRPFDGILAISQPENDGQLPIPNTEEEIKAIRSAMGDTAPVRWFEWLKGRKVTKEAVISGMASKTWVHLACHARQYPLNASESAFMLADRQTLSLEDISKHPSAGGEFAFLSACQTAAGDSDLSVEGIHLAAGMLTAGYRSVVATLWSVQDRDAPVVSKAVYNRLFRDGHEQIDRTGMALALYDATRKLREEVGEDMVLRWAPFVHLGL